MDENEPNEEEPDPDEEIELDLAEQFAASDQAERLAGGGLRIRFGLNLAKAFNLFAVAIPTTGAAVFTLFFYEPGARNTAPLFIRMVFGVPFLLFGLFMLCWALKNAIRSSRLTIKEGTLTLESSILGISFSETIPCLHLLDLVTEGHNLLLYRFDPTVVDRPNSILTEEWLWDIQGTVDPTDSYLSIDERVKPYATRMTRIMGGAEPNIISWIWESATRQARFYS